MKAAEGLVDISAISADAACLIVRVDEPALANAPKAEQEALGELLELLRDQSGKPVILIPPGWTFETATLAQLRDLAICCMQELEQRATRASRDNA